MYDELLDQWAIPRPRELTRASWGISNETWFVRSEAGEHVLRLHVQKRVEAIRFEHELLRRLATAELTFRTPVPVATEAGNTFVLEVDSARPAALFRRIGGEHLDDDDVDGVERAAAAFATLDIALGAIDRTDVAARAFSGDLRAVHPAISDLAQLEEIADRLIAHGRPADEPAAIVESATTSRQRVISAPLGDIAASARSAAVEAPAVLVVGPTAALATALNTRRRSLHSRRGTLQRRKPGRLRSPDVRAPLRWCASGA